MHVTHRIGSPKTCIEGQARQEANFFKRLKIERFAKWRAYADPHADPERT
jgi:hypothetical protein